MFDKLIQSMTSAMIVGIDEQDKYIATGFIYPDGDSVNLHLRKFVNEEWKIVDRGLTAEKLAKAGIDLKENHRELMRYVSNRFGIEFVGKEIQKSASESRLGIECIDFCSAIAYLAGLTYHRATRKTSDFTLGLESFVQSRVHRVYSPKWTAKDVDPDGVFPVDFHFNGIGEARNLFSVQSANKTNVVAAVTGFLASHGHDVPTMSVIDPEAKIPPKEIRRLEMVSTEICVGFVGHEDRIAKFASGLD